VWDLKGTSSLIVPMNFVSMRGSSLDNVEAFTIAKMTPEHWQLMGECVDHNLTVLPRLLRRYPNTNGGFQKWIPVSRGKTHG